MLGVALLVLSLLLYFSKKGRLMSYFLYVGFLLDGYGILIDPLLGGTKWRFGISLHCFDININGIER